MAGGPPARRRSGRACTRWPSATSGTRSPISATTKATPRRGRSAGRSCRRFLDYADDQVERAARSKRKGALAAYRDATIFKVMYGWGLRRTETSKLDIVDWGRNPAAAEFGGYGMLNVRYGKAKRGQPPRRRNVASVMGWAVEAVADYVENVRPRFGFDEHPALWVTERGGRVQPGGDQRPFRCLPRRARVAHGLGAALLPPLLCEPSDRERCLTAGSSRSRWATSATPRRPSTPMSARIS